MANILYRASTAPTVPASTSAKTTPLSNLEIDGNFKSINDELITKAPLASPTFTGTVVLPSTTSIGNISNIEINYLDGVTSAIQSQFSGKAPLTGEGTSGTWSISVTGNAGTVTNGLYSTGSYANPSWITSLDAAKITTGTMATAILGSGTANTTTYLRGDSTWAPVVSGASVSDDTTTDASYYPLWATATTGTPTTIYTSSTKFYFNPSTGTLNATGFNSLSDRDLKDNIAIIQDAENTVKSISGVEFTWKDSGRKSAGVIAQDLEQVLPWLVETSAEGTKSVNYAGLTAYLIETVKTLAARIEVLENK